MADSTLTSLVLGALFHDVGKFMQRAHADRELDERHPRSAAMAGQYCPSYQGRSTHLHVLWTDAFFDGLRESSGAPAGVDLALAQRVAVFHHRPDGAGADEALAWIVAEADRLSSGMDRRPDEGEEASRGSFRQKPLINPLSQIDIGRGAPQRAFQRVVVLSPDPEKLHPVADEEAVGRELPAQYKALWAAFAMDLQRLPDAAEHYVQGAQSLLERYAWAIPSSTVDLRDISLYDHAHTTAAIAASLYLYHRERAGGRALEPDGVKDRTRPAYRLVAGDLSGIQRTLFTLAAQGARGVAKVLRARSFLLGAVVESAALRTMEALGLPWVARVQSAGGRFVLLAPNLGDLDRKLDTVRAEVDAWLVERHLGELSLHVAATDAFTGADFVEGRFPAVLEGLSQAVENAKQRPLSTQVTGPLRVPFPHGVCPMCARRPAAGEQADCGPCAVEKGVGQRLPRARFLAFGSWEWLHARHRPADPVPMPGGLGLVLLAERPARDLDGYARLEHLGEDPFDGLPSRFLAQYVPRFETEGEWDHDVFQGFAGADEGPGEWEVGGLKTFQHLGALARERDPRKGGYRGKPFLGVLKADVDYLGLVFAEGIAPKKQSLSRYAGLSRMLDFFFAAHLPWLTQRDAELRDTYTVYAGGDDLLMVGPWRQTLGLAGRLRDSFRAFSGGNPNVTLSAALLHTSVNQPLQRAAAEADEHLEQAKEAGRDRLWLFGQVVPWAEFPQVRETADTLVQWLDQGQANRGFVHRLYQYAKMARAAESDPRQAIWRAHFGYDLKRNFKKPEVMKRVLDLVGLGPDLRQRNQALAALPAAVHWALYRVRS